jgi:hypothetical protein
MDTKLMSRLKRKLRFFSPLETTVGEQTPTSSSLGMTWKIRDLTRFQALATARLGQISNYQCALPRWTLNTGCFSDSI